MHIGSKKQELLKKSWLLFMQAANDSLSLYDRDLNLIEINEAAVGMFPKGTLREDILGRNLSDLISDLVERGHFQRFKEVFETGEPLFLENAVPPREFGEDRHFDLKVLKVGDCLGIIATDVTDIKRTDQILHRRETDLRLKTRVLEEVNTALKVLLRQRESDREELGDSILANVRKLVLPCLDRLKQSRLTESQRTDLGLLEENLKNIVSPFISRLTEKFIHLTPTEIMVADLVRQGKTSKEIASVADSSLRSIEFHRSNLRSKLGLRNRKTNLRTYLLSLE